MDTGAYFSLSVNDINKTSTEAQHKLFFRICGMVAEESGHEFIEIRDFMYESCLPVMETGDNDIFGDAIIERRGLSMLDIKEFNIFLEKVIVIANSNFDMGLELHASEEFGTIIKTKE